MLNVKQIHNENCTKHILLINNIESWAKYMLWINSEADSAKLQHATTNQKSRI